MDLWHGLLLISSIHLLAAASPGPDFVLVSQQTLAHGKKTGMMCSIGISLGLSVHILYSALGLAAIIANSSTALLVIKVLGGSYLIYLGSKGIRAKASATSLGSDKEKEQETPQSAGLKSIGTGFICNVLNPKAPIYFVSLFTVVLSPSMPLYQIAIYGIWIMIIQLCWFSAVVLLLSRPSVHNKFQAMGHWIDRILGGAMILLGLKVLLTKTS